MLNIMKGVSTSCPAVRGPVHNLAIEVRHRLFDDMICWFVMQIKSLFCNTEAEMITLH